MKLVKTQSKNKDQIVAKLNNEMMNTIVNYENFCMKEESVNEVFPHENNMSQDKSFDQLMNKNQNNETFDTNKDNFDKAPVIGVIFEDHEEILNDTIQCSVKLKPLEVENKTVSIIPANIPKEIFPFGLENYDLLDEQSPF